MRCVPSPFHDVFERFAALGWHIDEDKLTMSGLLHPYMKHTEVFHVCTLEPERNRFGIDFCVRTRYPFNGPAQEFLSYMEHCMSDAMTLSWEQPSTFSVGWYSEAVGCFEDVNRKMLERTLKDHIVYGQRLVLSIAHVLTTYGRLKGENILHVPHYMQPPILAQFCVSDSGYTERGFNT